VSQPHGQLRIEEVPPERRSALEALLDQSFDGWYLRHSKKTLAEIATVRAALVEGRPVGLVMLRTLHDVVGYVYYIAVAKDFRRRGIGKLLLARSLEYFATIGMKECYASIEEDNAESAALFRSIGFMRTGYGEVSGKYGRLRALNMYRSMLVVPGEILLCLPLGPDASARSAPSP